MSFTPHTQDEIRLMLQSLQLNRLDDLFSEIPKSLHRSLKTFESIPEALSELDLSRLMEKRAAQDGGLLNFIGAGAYEHFIPAAVWEIASRGEWMTAYTPYQAEASQGTLQLLYEYQTMMAHLMAMDVSNASLYDGASALAETILMAARCLPKVAHPRVGLPLSVHPAYRRVVKTLTQALGIRLVDIPFLPETGQMAIDVLSNLMEDMDILVIPQPNFFGVLEPIDEIMACVQAKNCLTIAQVNPLLMSYLIPPGEWGGIGVDFACGEGQPLGIPLSSGGPYFGFLCCRMKWVRQLPGRLIGRTTDSQGREGFVLTLQAREQHIRRAKATSNICTNQGLLVTAATIYLSLMGARGLQTVVKKAHENTQHLVKAACQVPGISLAFPGPYMHEAVLRFSGGSSRIQRLNQFMLAENISPGYALGSDYPGLADTLLVCATETKTEADIAAWIAVVKKSMA